MVLNPVQWRVPPFAIHGHMYEWDAARAQCWVVTRREGVLKRVGHDLRIVVERFFLRASAEQRTAELSVDSESLKVDCALEGERRLPGALSTRDRSTINEQLRSEVLRTRLHPEVRFTSEALTPALWQALTTAYEFSTGPTAQGTPPGPTALPGSVSLCGVTRPVSVQVRATPQGLLAHASIDQTRFGIEPYRGMLGALRVSASVDVYLQIHSSQSTGQ